ncbi:MAG: PIG-L family deacetylase [Candidatus Nanopelagicales bacterium]
MSLRLTDAVVLVLAPHTDDGELGAGAAISRFIRDGNEVHYAAFSACETVQPPDARTRLHDECRASTGRLGIPTERVQIFDLEVRQFARDRQRVLDVMVELNQRIRPDMVIGPSIADTHQDHDVVAQEARRAFKRSRLLGYEMPWNNFHFRSTAFVSVERVDAETKIAALAEYSTQASRPYMVRDYQEAQLRFRGVQVGVEFAEAFEVIRWFL